MEIPRCAGKTAAIEMTPSSKPKIGVDWCGIRLFRFSGFGAKLGFAVLHFDRVFDGLAAVLLAEFLGLFLHKRLESVERAGGSFGNRPLIVLASGSIQHSSSEAAWNQRRINEEQPGLAALSTKGRVIVVDGAVGLEAAVSAVRSAVLQVR